MLEKTAAVKRDLEKVGEIPELMFRLLILLNFLIVLFVTLISAHALWGYVNEGTALDFLLSAGRIPPANWVLPVTGIMLFGCLVLLLTVECNNHPELVSKLTVEFAIAIGVSYVTGFGYTGMIVLLLADIMRYTIDWKKRALYILAVSIFYLFMNGNALRDWLGAIPLSVSWEYYRADHLGVLQSGPLCAFSQYPEHADSYQHVCLYLLYGAYGIGTDQREREYLKAQP